MFVPGLSSNKICDNIQCQKHEKQSFTFTIPFLLSIFKIILFWGKHKKLFFLLLIFLCFSKLLDKNDKYKYLFQNFWLLFISSIRQVEQRVTNWK